MFRKIICAIIIIFMTGAVDAQTITGKITGNNATPVAHAIIYLLNTNYSSNSDAEGNFILKNVLPGHYILSVSAAGYAVANKNITGKN